MERQQKEKISYSTDAIIITLWVKHLALVEVLYANALWSEWLHSVL